jgi:hypothetical protein
MRARFYLTLPGQIARLFQIAEIEDRFPIFPTQDEAIANLRSEPSA